MFVKAIACLTLDLAADGFGDLHDRTDEVELYDHPSISKQESISCGIRNHDVED